MINKVKASLGDFRDCYQFLGLQRKEILKETFDTVSDGYDWAEPGMLPKVFLTLRSAPSASSLLKIWTDSFRTSYPLSDQERFKCEHLEEVETLRTRDGIWLDVGVMYTVGTKPTGKLIVDETKDGGFGTLYSDSFVLR